MDEEPISAQFLEDEPTKNDEKDRAASAAASPNDSNRDHHLIFLEAELQRVDLLVRRQARLWQLAGQDASDALRGIRITGEDAARLAQIPVGANWARLAEMNPEETERWNDALKEAQQQVDRCLARARAAQVIPKLLHLARAFHLTPVDYDVLLIALAPALDLRYQKLYGYLQDDVRLKQPSVNLALELLCLTGLDRLTYLKHFAPEAVLFRFELLQPVDSKENGGTLLNQPLLIDPALCAWLLGEYRARAELGSALSLQHPDLENGDAVVASEAWPRLAEAIHEQPILSFYGPDQESRNAVGRLIAHSLRRALLSVDLQQSVEAGVTPLRALRLALRDARLTNAIVQLSQWQVCLNDDEAPTALLREVYEHPDLVIVSSAKKWYAREVTRDVPVLWLDFPHPTSAQRQTLWSHFLKTFPHAAPQDSAFDVAELAGQFILNSRQIRDSIVSAWDAAIQRGDQFPAKDDLFAAARAQSSTRLAELARKIEPRYAWDDLVLPDDQLEILREIVDMVRSRPQVLESWGLGKKLASSAAVTVLFAGPPGTGKTMAAEVIARELGLDLYKIDLSSMVSKYIGETEKNLDKIFNEAQSSNAILFFDEADAIFGKRSQVKDARDRYANIEVSYLLQRMETYDGVTILATNLRANLDEAFLRRLQFAIDVPFPDEKDRLRIWQTLLPENLPRAPDLNLEEMAKRFKLAGGNIRNILVTAAYQAASNGGVVTMEHLMHGTRRELQKMGRLVSDQQMQIG